jgi:nucleoside-diphosphate-sugar epimerase
MSSILVAGCGFVGNELARRLCAQRHEVWGLRRNISALPPGVHPVAADLRDVSTLDALPTGLDAIVYTAAPDESSDSSYKEIYVDGLSRLLERSASMDRPPTRLILVSSTGVYGQNDGAAVNESSPTEPTRFSGRRLLESECIATQSGLTTTVIRFGGIYGPGRTALIERVKAGSALLTNGPSYTNRIHRDDCASAIAHILTLATPPTTVIGVDENAADRNDVIDWMAARLGVPTQVDDGSESTPSGKRCSAALLRSTGYEFIYPSYREGYPSIIDGYLSAAKR